MLYRLSVARLEGLLPPGLAPRTQAGCAVGSVCYTRLGPVLPGSRGPGSEHLAYRLAVQREDGTPAGWVARRETSSWLEARCARLLPGPRARARFTCNEAPFALELSVRGAEGEEFYLRGETAPNPRPGLFAHARELVEFLAAEREVRPQDVFAPEADQLELDDGFAPEPLSAFEARSRFWSEGPFAAAGPELDSAWRLTSVRREPAPARRATFRVLPQGTDAAPLYPTS